MPASKGISGQRFGRLAAIRCIERRSRKTGCKSSMWLCRCDDGNEVVVPLHHLTSGRTRSCGCLKLETARRNGEQSATHGHSRENCYWATPKERDNHLYTIGDQTRTIAQWARRASIDPGKLRKRIDAGWGPELIRRLLEIDRERAKAAAKKRTL